MGAIYERQGVWYVDLRVQGRRIRKKVGTSKKLADLALKDLQIKAERNQLGFLDRKEISLKSFLDEYLTYSRANHRPASSARYRAVVQNFLSFIQKETQISRVRQVTTDTIEKYRVWRRSTPVARNGHAPEKVNRKAVRDGAKAYTVNFEVRALRTIFYFGMRSNYLEANPVKGMKFLKTDDSKQRRFLSDAECRRLLEKASKEDYPVFALFMNTGMRRSELVNLEWSDIDFKSGLIKIRRKPFWLPKSGERDIPMNETAQEILMRLPNRGNFVFTDAKGKQLNPDTLRGNLVQTAKLAGVDSLTEIHALRHTFASQLIQRGVDLPSVQKLMGHSNIQTTMIYTHQTSDHLKAAISKLQYALKPMDRGSRIAESGKKPRLARAV